MIKKIASIVSLVLLFSHAAFAITLSGDGRKTVAAAGTAEALSATSQKFRQLIVCAETDNTNPVTVGTSPVGALATREGVPLSAGVCTSIFNDDGDLSLVKIDVITNGEGVTYYWQYR